MSYIMVLNDGETFTDLAGCRIVEVPDNWETEEIEEALESINDPDSEARIVRSYNYDCCIDST